MSPLEETLGNDWWTYPPSPLLCAAGIEDFIANRRRQLMHDIVGTLLDKLGKEHCFEEQAGIVIVISADGFLG